ncbi:hypothetical protein RvY_06402-1 [Ramazzottius varieornatus]|uniref:Uncharacterized protein n=1 Tax=Ramazzottius varieornatus TaxID=947166 RepID=A0A1D1V1X7_RAMVA|nr:hypothetical protein RvY_06402-1 [Ramazzottius varieornatus]
MLMALGMIDLGDLAPPWHLCPCNPVSSKRQGKYGRLIAATDRALSSCITWGPCLCRLPSLATLSCHKPLTLDFRQVLLIACQMPGQLLRYIVCLPCAAHTEQSTYLPTSSLLSAMHASATKAALSFLAKVR